MKRLVSCMLVVVMMCVVFTTVAAGAGFVPSVSYKPAPEIVEIEGHDKGDLVIVPVADAKNDDKLPEDIKNDLLEQYEKLSDPDAKISDLVDGLPEDLVIKDLFGIANSNPKVDVFKDGKTVNVVLKTNVAKGDNIYAMIFADGEWKKVSATNNGDGTITVALSYPGVVALMTEADAANVTVPETGDNTNIGLWVAIMISCAALIAVLVIAQRRNAAKEGK